MNIMGRIWYLGTASRAVLLLAARRIEEAAALALERYVGAV